MSVTPWSYLLENMYLLFSHHHGKLGSYFFRKKKNFAKKCHLPVVVAPGRASPRLAVLGRRRAYRRVAPLVVSSHTSLPSQWGPSINLQASRQSARVPFVTRNRTGIPCASTARCILVLSPLLSGSSPDCRPSLPTHADAP